MLNRNRIDKRIVIKTFIECLIPFAWSVYFALWENGKVITDKIALFHFIIIFSAAVLMVLSWRIIEILVSDVMHRMCAKAITIFLWVLLIVLMR